MNARTAYFFFAACFFLADTGFFAGAFFFAAGVFLAGASLCARAAHFGSHSYGAIKNILQQGLDLTPLPTAAPKPPSELPRPRFAREIQELFHRTPSPKDPHELH